MASAVRPDWIMLRRVSLLVALLSATTAVAVAQDFKLGVDFSELIPTSPLTEVASVRAATDLQGAVYVLIGGLANSQNESFYLVKLTPAGDRVVYRTSLGFWPFGFAVDPAGNVYLSGGNLVEKLATDGTTVVYKTALGNGLNVDGNGLSSEAIAVDATGRAYVAGTVPSGGLNTTPRAFQQTPPTAPSQNEVALEGFVVRLEPDGAVGYATYLGDAGNGGWGPNGIAVDGEGSAFVTGLAHSDFPTTPGAYMSAPGIASSGGAPYLARLSPDGSTLIYSTFTPGTYSFAVAVDRSDNATIITAGTAILRFNPQGTALILSRFLPGSSPSGLAVDAAGNTYLVVGTSANYVVNNSLAPCEVNQSGQSSALTALDASGEILQATYVEGSLGYPLGLGFGPNSTVYVVGLPNATYSPTTQQLGGSSSGLVFLTRLSPNARSQTVKLACIGNSASYDGAGVAGGEIVSLFGQGLGPTAGTQPQLKTQSEFPKQLAAVEVTFNGIPGPLLYVQDGQINAIAPWSLQSGQTVQVCVVYNGAPTNCLSRPVLDAHPGVFTVDGSYAAAVNQDGTLNSASSPAQVGSIVSIFATGLGPISPPQSDGAIVGLPLPVNVSPAQIWVPPLGLPGSQPTLLTLKYAGPAPFQVAGVSQINFVVQDSIPLFLQAGSTISLEGGPLRSNPFQVHVAGRP